MPCPVEDCQYPDSECLLEMDPFADEFSEDDAVCALEGVDSLDDDPVISEVTLAASPVKVIADFLHSGDGPHLGIHSCTCEREAHAILAELTSNGWSLTRKDL